jgi:hypothetical protein
MRSCRAGHDPATGQGDAVTICIPVRQCMEPPLCLKHQHIELRHNFPALACRGRLLAFVPDCDQRYSCLRTPRESQAV